MRFPRLLAFFFLFAMLLVSPEKGRVGPPGTGMAGPVPAGMAPPASGMTVMSTLGAAVPPALRDGTEEVRRQMIGRLAMEYPGLDPDYIDLVARAISHFSLEQGVDPWLVYAVAQTESNFDSSQRGSAGERGLMQVLPGTARLVTRLLKSRGEEMAHAQPDRLQDVIVNVFYGVRYLRYVLEANGGDVAKALTEYNTGRRGAGPNGYARRVLARYWRNRPPAA